MTKTKNEIRGRLEEHIGMFLFDYNGVRCGVDPYSDTEIELYCGDSNIIVSGIDEAMNTPFFSGKSLADISGDIEVIDW